MTTPTSAPPPTVENSDASMKRHGLFAAAWAAVIGAIVKSTTEPIEASAGLLFVDTTTSVTNTPSGPTVLLASNASYSGSASVFTGQTVVSSAMAGLQGVAGLRSPAPIECGVVGTSGRGAGTAGVLGYGNGASIGVMVRSDSRIPIQAQVPTTSTANTIALCGLNLSSYTSAKRWRVRRVCVLAAGQRDR